MMRSGLFDPKPARSYPSRRLSDSSKKETRDSSKDRKALNNSSGTSHKDSNKVFVDEGLEDHDADFAVEKKQYAKEKAPVSSGGKIISDDKDELDEENESETETLHNTNLNAMLYHTSEDSIDLYRSENNSSDLLGRLYYDDYDPENRQVVERVTSYTSLQALARAPASPGFSRPTVDLSNEQQATPVSKLARRPSFARQVSFDTLSDSHHQAITLKVKHPEFKFRRNNKTFLIGFSNDSESMKAVEWAFLEMVISGDTIVVFQVLDEKTHNVVDASLAEAVLDTLKKLNTHKKRISLVYEVVIGNPQKLLKKAILEYKPAMMIVGTKHYGPAPESAPPASTSGSPMTPFLSHPQPVRQNTLYPSTSHSSSSSAQTHHHSSLHRSIFSKSSTSKYFLQYALVPVILVKPSYTIHETLDRPVDSENYFSDWLANIDVSQSREKKKKHMFGIRSRSSSSSRNSSHTSLSDFMHRDRSSERIHEKLAERLQDKSHESRGRSSGESFLFSGSGSRESSRSRSRSRPISRQEISSESGLDATIDSGVRSGSRSRSRSRLSRLFSG